MVLLSELVFISLVYDFNSFEDLNRFLTMDYVYFLILVTTGCVTMCLFVSRAPRTSTGLCADGFLMTKVEVTGHVMPRE